jgi:hypothetical protein
LGHTMSGELSEGVSGSHNHREAVAGALQKKLQQAQPAAYNSAAKALLMAVVVEVDRRT